MEYRLAVVLAVVALICPIAFTAPATRSTCTPVCKSNDHHKLNYEEGKSYVYAFETEVSTESAGPTDETSRFTVKGEAVFAVQSSCDYILTLQQVAIMSPSGQAVSKVEEVEGSSLRFAYQNGEIESVCVSEDDPTWSANIKRAVASLLINKVVEHEDSSTKTSESDISGRCPTRYTVDGNHYNKTKDLNSCTHRDGGYTLSFGVPYQVPSKFNSLPLVNADLSCEQELSPSGIFQSINCLEHHRLSPFQVQLTNGIQTTVKSSLTLISTLDRIQKGSHSSTKQSSIYYDHSEADKTQSKKTSATRAVDLLNKICPELEGSIVSSKVPGLFLQLKHSISSARKDDLKQIYDDVSGGKVCPDSVQKLKTLVLEAAATSASDAGIGLIVDRILNHPEDISESFKGTFLVHATFAPHPGPEGLKAMESLISGSDAPSRYLLAASGLAHRYCHISNQDCGSNPEYQALVNKIASRVKTSSDPAEVKKVIAALQSLGNLDTLTPSAVTALTTILQDKEASERLKVRALDAFRRDPCQEALKAKALSIFGNVKESSQIRIQAYLALTKCVLDGDVKAVQDVLDMEQSNQVGSFVSSHIENVLESASPDKSQLQTEFKKLNLKKGQPRDPRRFSRNFEVSAFSDAVNLGGSVDGNLIFSQDSYLPRSSSANLTVDLFGRSYNFLEVGLYTEDLENIVESYFGPEGKVRKVSYMGLVQRGMEKIETLKREISKRFKRTLRTETDDNEIDSLREQVDIHERIGDQPTGDIYIRVVGTSILVETVDKDCIQKPDSIYGNIRTGLERMIEGAKDHSFDLTEPFVFLDDGVSVPTSSGFPLNFHLEGTSILSLKMQGNLDIKAILKGNGIEDMRAKVIPSASTIVKAKMTVGSGPVESGLQIEGKIHSSSGVDLKIVQDNNKFEVKFNFPQEKTQVFDIRTDVYWVEQVADAVEKKTPISTKLAPLTVRESECLAGFSKLLGFKVCADLKLSGVSRQAPLYFLNGPNVASLYIEKSEPSMEGYYLKVERTRTDADYVIDFLLDTPGSKVNRKINAKLEGIKYKSTTPAYNLRIASPWTKFDVEYNRANTEALKSVDIKIVNNGEAYGAGAELKKTIQGGITKYQPTVQYQIAGGKPVKLVEGEIIRVQESRLEINIRTTGPISALRGSVKGIVEVPRKDETGFELKLTGLEISSVLAGKISFDGTVERRNKVLESKLKATYGEAKHTFDLETKVGKPSDDTLVVVAKTQSSRLPFLSLDFDWKVTKSQDQLDHHLEYSRGAAEPKVILISDAKLRIVSARNFEIHSELTFKHPQLKIDLHSKADAKAAPGEPRHLELTLKANALTSALKYETTSTNLRDYSVQAHVEVGGKKYEISEVSTKVADSQNFMTRFAVTPGFWYLADTNTSFKFEKSELETDISTLITSDRLTNPILFKAGVRGKPAGYAALLRVDAKGENVLYFTTQFKHIKSTKPGEFNVNAFVQNYVNATLAETFSKAGLDATFNAHWFPTGRKLAGLSKLTIQGNAYNFDGDFKWDAEQDPTKHIALKSITNLSLRELQIDSNNEITVKENTAKINLKGSGAKDVLNGHNTLSLSYTTPTENTYTIATEADIENKLKIKGAKVNVKLTLPGESPLDFTVEQRVSNLNRYEKTFDSVTDIKIDYKGQKDVHLKAELASAVPGNYRAYSGKIALDGSVVPEPLSAQFKSDIKKGKYSLQGSASRGARKGDLNLAVEYDKWSPKKTWEAKYSVNTPYDRFKSVEGEVKLGLLFNAWNSFEYSEAGTFSLNQEGVIAWTYETSLLNKNLKYHTTVSNDGKQILEVVADGKLVDKKFSTKLEVNAGEIKNHLNLEIEHDLPHLKFHLEGASPSLIKKQDASIDILLTHEEKTKGIYETDILAKTSGALAFRVTNKLELSPKKKSIDFVVAAAESPSRRLHFLLNEAQKNKYNVEALLQWGEGGKFISSKGDLNKADADSFDATLTLDSPELGADKFNVVLAKKARAVNLKVNGNGKEQLVADMDYGTRDERSGLAKIFEGKLNLKSEIKNFNTNLNGKFYYGDAKFQRARGDAEEGREWKMSLDIVRDAKTYKVEASAKKSDLEKRLQLLACKDGGEKSCTNGDIHLRHAHESNGDLDYTLRIIGERQGPSGHSLSGLTFHTTMTEGGKHIEHVAKVILTEEHPHQIGYRLYRKDAEVGAELLLPERVISTQLKGTNPVSGEYAVELAFFFDKLRQADRKVSFLLHTERVTKSRGIGRLIEVVVTHPDIPKELKVKTTYALGDESSLVDVETVLDIFKDDDNKIVFAYKIHRSAISEGNYHKAEWSVKSEGQSIQITGESDLTKQSGEISYKHVVNYMNREKQVKISKLLFSVSLKKLVLKIDGPETKLVSIVSTIGKEEDHIDSRQEVLLPGMESTRIFATRMALASPYYIQTKVYHSSSPDGVYYESFLGFRDEDHLVVGLYDHEESGEKVLADLKVGLKNKRVLNIKADWDKENVKNVLTKVQVRARKNVENVRELVQSSTAEIIGEVKNVAENLKKASPNLKVVLTSTKDKLNDLLVELDAHEDTKLVLDKVKEVRGLLKGYLKTVAELFKIAKRLAAATFFATQEKLEALTQRFIQVYGKVPYTSEDIQAFVDKVMERLEGAYVKAVELIGKGVQRIIDNTPKIIDRINWFLDVSSGVTDCIRSLLKSVVSELCTFVGSVKTAVQSILDNQMLKDLLKDGLLVGEILLSEIIDETKVQAESVKNYILKTVPQKEFQQVVEAVADYVEKKWKKQAVDDAAVLNDIYEKVVAVARKAVNHVFSFELKDGSALASIPLPMPVRSLSDMYKIFQDFSFPSLPKVHFKIPNYTYGIRQTINKLRHGASIHEVLPPFDATALLIGSQYFKSFDGKFFRYDGNCQYLLASDFQDANFTLAIDYDNRQRTVEKAIIIKDHTDTIAIKPDNTVYVNGEIMEVTEALLSAGTSFRVRSKGDWVIVEGPQGVKVGCSAVDDVCAFKVNGYYHGKVLGLLGKFNDESYDDFSTPKGEIVDNVNEFATSWKIENSCSETHVAQMPVIRTSVQEKCADIFTSRGSSLRPCFGVIEPKDYQNICEQLSAAKGYNEEKAVCTAAAGYRKACFMAYTFVDTVDECRKV